MIRINLLGQAKPKASRRPVDTGAALPVLFVGAGVLFGALILGYLYYSWQRQLNDENTRIKQLQGQKTDLEQVKQQVEAFEKQKTVLQQRVSTIEQLQRDRTGGQELLDEIASTVARTENLWITSMIRKGNNLTIDGASASVNGVANFITALKRSGYFAKIEIKESKQDDKNTAVQTFMFEVSAEITPPPAGVPQSTFTFLSSATTPSSTATTTPSSTATSTVATSTNGTSTVPASASSSTIASTTSSSSISFLQAQLNALLAQLSSLQAQAGASASPNASSSYIFTTDLMLWDEGPEVTALQSHLIQQDKGPAAEKLKAHGITNVFGFLTYNALVEYQASVGIHATGYFGPITRAYVNG